MHQIARPYHRIKKNYFLPFFSSILYFLASSPATFFPQFQLLIQLFFLIMQFTQNPHVCLGEFHMLASSYIYLVGAVGGWGGV